VFHASLAVALALSFGVTCTVALTFRQESVLSCFALPIVWSTMVTFSISIIFVKSARFTGPFRHGRADTLPVESRPLRLTIACLLPSLLHAIMVAVIAANMKKLNESCYVNPFFCDQVLFSLLLVVIVLLVLSTLRTSYQMGSTMFQFKREEASWIFFSCFLLLLIPWILFLMFLVDGRTIELTIATFVPVVLSFNVIPLCWQVTANHKNNNFMFVDKKVWQTNSTGFAEVQYNPKNRTDIFSKRIESRSYGTL
jgi:hypothetical protein